MPEVDEDVALKFVHTADWHLGKDFPAFEQADRDQLTRARLDVLDRVFGLAERNRVHAVLCAGDLFDSPNPSKNWWQALADKFNRLAWTDRPVFLLPGNHDPLTATSVYSQEHGFRKALPSWVRVIEDDNQEVKLSEEAVLYASPCRSQSGQSDLAMGLPQRQSGDTRIRIGLVHGSTFDMPGYQMNFPISRTAAEDRGLDYLAIGDTHAFRHVPPDASVPTIYPSAPEPTSFGETEAGYAAVVFVKRLGRKPRVQKERVARWTWQDRTCRSLPELEQLRLEDLTDHVVRLSVEMSLPTDEYGRAEEILSDLQGTNAKHGKVGILQLDRSSLDLDITNVETAFENAPDVLRRAAERLRNTTGEAAPAARRALYHLYRLSRDGAR